SGDENAIRIEVAGDGNAQIWFVLSLAGGVSISAGGEIVEYGDAASDVFAKSLSASAGHGVRLGTSVDTLSAVVCDSGDIEIGEYDAVRLQHIVTSDGNIHIHSVQGGTIEI